MGFGIKTFIKGLFPKEKPKPVEVDHSYDGNRFYCPLCETSFGKLKDNVGFYYLRGELLDHYTANANCPKCNSGIRHRFLLTFLINKHIDMASKKILHFAPEPGIARFLLKQPGIDYMAADIDPQGYPREFNAKKVDITAIPFSKDSFDGVVCCHVLEHIKDDRLACQELYRVIKAGGWAIVSLPIYGETTFEDASLNAEGRMKMYGIDQHMRLNGLDFRQKLEAAGFKVMTVSIDDVPGNYVDRSATSPHINSDKYLFYCEK